MNSSKQISSPLTGHPRRRSIRAAIVIFGILIGQCILYGPAIVGQKLLLPADLLMLPGVYKKEVESTKPRRFTDFVQTDQIILYEPARRFAAAEIRAGRWPAWSPYQFCGSPSGGTQWSCFQFLYVLWPNPKVLAYIQVLVALVAGTGAYLFLRRVFELAYWPAAIAAWCYPLTGFFVLWQGHSLPHSAVWLPWALWSTDRAIQYPRGLGGVILASVTFFTIGCGAIDIAAQLLLVSGGYALCRIVEVRLLRWSGARSLITSTASPVAGWALGFVLAAGMLFPMAEYLPTGVRVLHRMQGTEERPPIGLDALPLVVLPTWNGSTRSGSYYIAKTSNVCESASTAYAGLFATLFLLPLAASSGLHRRRFYFWFLLGFLGIAWQLNVPGIVNIYRLPILNMFSFNRFTFVTGWSILCLSAMGLDTLCRGNQVSWWWCPIPIVLALVIGVICLERAFNLPDPLATKLEALVQSGVLQPNLANHEDVITIKRGFVAMYQVTAICCGSVLLGWMFVLSKWFSPRSLFAMASTVFLCELVWFAKPAGLMSDPEDYFPTIPILKQLAQAPPGRIVGLECLPPRVVEHYGLYDIRGYDAVDPSGIVELLDLVRDNRIMPSRYARTMNFVPRIYEDRKGIIRVPGILSLLNLRYLIFQNDTPTEKMKPLLSGDGYSIWENPAALPRAFVPRNVSNDRSGKLLLATMAQPDFNAAEQSYAEVSKPYLNCRGQARIVHEHPQEIEIELDMETPGVLVLSDLWYKGWQAELEGHLVPIVRANYSLRGVEIPAGKSRLVMTYKPVPLKWGLRVSVFGVLVLLLWGGLVARGPQKPAPLTANPQSA